MLFHHNGISIAALPLALLVAACGGGGGAVLATTPTPDATTTSVEIPPLEGGFECPVPKGEWTPVMIAGEGGAQLSSALSDRGSVMLLLGRGMDAAEEDRVFQMVKAAASETAVVARDRGTLDKLLQERGEIPYRTTMEPAGTDMFGRPYLLPKHHPLRTEWLANEKALKGAEGMLTVRRIRVDDQKLRELRRRRRGDCSPLSEVLAGGVESGRSLLAAYEQAANASLERAFRRHLEVALSFWREEVAAARVEADPSGEAIRCLDAYQQMLESYAPCLERDCGLQPAMLLCAGGAIGIDRGPFNALPDRCPAAGVRDYSAEIRELAARAADEVLPSLNGPWTGEVLRLAALQRLQNGIEDFCAPRHRRFSARDLESAREELRDLIARLGRKDLDGEWYPSSGMERAPGTGPVEVVARLRALGSDPDRDVEEMLDRLRGIERCHRGGERTVQAALVDVGSSEVVFMGIFFEEQLLCEDLPPGSP